MKLMRFRWLYFAISLAVLLPGIVSLVLVGLRPAIDFTGGSLLEIRIPESTTLDQNAIQTQLAQTYEVTAVQSSGQGQFIVRGKTITNDQKIAAVDALTQESGGEVEVLRFETIGPTLGRETVIKMITAIAIVAVMITLYIWYQFQDLKYGVCAVLAMFHDTLVLLGSFSLLGYFFGIEVDVLFVTAVLTTLSFSVHDTIVVYDRIRELRRKHRQTDFETVVNAAVLETLGRSINNSVTIIIMLATLSLLGGQTIRWFSVALLVGAITGTYSSTFTAAPLLLLWDTFKKK